MFDTFVKTLPKNDKQKTQRNLRMSHEHWESLLVTEKAVEPFYLVTKEMSHSQAVTLSSAIVLLLGLILSLNKTSAEYQKDQVDNFYIEAVEAGVNKLKAYLQKMMQSQLYLIAPIVDPCYHNTIWDNSASSEGILDPVEAMLRLQNQPLSHLPLRL